MAAVEFGGDLHRQSHGLPSLLHGIPFRYSPHEIAAEADKALHLAGEHAFAGLNRVHALVSRRLETEQSCELVQRH